MTIDGWTEEHDLPSAIPELDSTSANCPVGPQLPEIEHQRHCGGRRTQAAEPIVGRLSAACAAFDGSICDTLARV
ncbi:MAG TPA: hypothetical protein VFS32_05975 [Candidatus Limnocylindrales bacterium]|nr:hypothetical protein [Candidatus Limnocylindrales bacterium]